jgi:hypothetical protein
MSGTRGSESLFRSHSRIRGGAAGAQKGIDLSAYIALLSRMQSAFYKRYEAFPLTKGNRFAGSVVQA